MHRFNAVRSTGKTIVPSPKTIMASGDVVLKPDFHGTGLMIEKNLLAVIQGHGSLKNRTNVHFRLLEIIYRFSPLSFHSIRGFKTTENLN